MLGKVNATKVLATSIHELILEAQKNERREQTTEARYTFFRPVSINTTEGRCYSGFCREISPIGIGLMHDMALTQGQIECSISRPEGPPLTMQLEIIWCQPCGDGWYISGGKFIGLDGTTDC